MTLRKRVLNVVLFVIAAVTALTVGNAGNYLSGVLSRLLSLDIKPYTVQLFYILLIALACRIVVNRFELSKKIIILLILVFLVFSVLYTRYQFYDYQAHPDFGDMKNVPECMKESNYATFWEYLNNSCHLTLQEYARLLSYKTLAWLLGFFGSGFGTQRARRKKSHAELIDEPEE